MSERKIENGIIGCLLLDISCIYQIYDDIKPDMFESEFCKDVYAKMLESFETGQPYDVNILANKLIDTDAEKQLTDCIMSTPSSVLLDGYTKQLIEDYKNKQANNIMRAVLTGDYITDGCIDNTIRQLEELRQGKKQTAKSIKEIGAEYRDIYFSEKNKQELTVCIGLDKIDDYIMLVGGDITIIGARPSVGKSAFALQIAIINALRGKKVGYFNLEMLNKQILDRILSNVSGLSLARVQRAVGFLGDEQMRYEDAMQNIDNMNLIISTGSKTELDIKAECRHENFDLIIIDYLQLVRYSKRTESRRVEVGEVSRALKNLALELNVPIIILSQLSRNSEYKPDKEPTMADLRETGDIEQDASNILLLWNISENEKKYKGIKIDKNREGELTKECLEFIGDNMTFIESTESIEDIKNLDREFQSFSDNPFQ